MQNDRAQKALELRGRGYNCAQAIACAYCDLFDMDENSAFRLSEGFGSGMGLMEVCGALSGAFMLAGLKNSSGVKTPGRTKAGTYQINRAMANAFREKNGTIICRELKGVDTGAPVRSCQGCIEDAAAIIEKVLLKQE